MNVPSLVPECTLRDYSECVYENQPRSMMIARCLYNRGCLSDAFSRQHTLQCSRIVNPFYKDQCYKQLVLNVRDNLTYPWEILE